MPRLSETSRAQQRKNTNYAPLVGNFRGSAEKKHGFRLACRKLPGLNREKTWISPRLSETSGAQQRKNVNYRAFRNVGYNKCRDAHRGRMFRLLWTFVDLKLPSAMSHAIHKIVSKERCQSYFISRRSPHLGISKDSELCASAHRCLHYAYARLIARVTFHLQYNYIRAFHIIGEVVHFAGGETQYFGAQHRIGNVLHNTGGHAESGGLKISGMF